MIRVLLVDDQELVRTGLRMILESEDDIEVVGEARNGREGAARVRRLRPDVVLMDIRMPELDGVEATRQIVDDPDQDSRVLILTTYDLDEYVFAALRAGAAGFLLKHTPADTLVDGIRTVSKGDALLAPEVTRRVIERFATMPDRPPETTGALESLTERERDVFRLLADGLSNPEIAKALFVEPSTVKTHVANVLNKLGVPDRVAAVIYAYEHGLIVPGKGWADRTAT